LTSRGHDGAIGGLPMSEISDGWEVMACRGKQPWHLIAMLFQMLVGNPDIVPVVSTATWTVRQIATGTVRNVTARSRQEAKEKIANGIFDGN
jgi:hypothetical protein